MPELLVAAHRSAQPSHPADQGRGHMSKRGRKRRSRKGNAANHGKRPNA